MGKYLLSLTKKSGNCVENFVIFVLQMEFHLQMELSGCSLSDWGLSVLGEVTVATVTGDKSSVFSR